MKVLCFLTSTNSTLPLFGLRSIEYATHNPACVISDTLSHFFSGFKAEEPPLVRGSHGVFESHIFSEDLREWAETKVFGWNTIRVQQLNSIPNQNISYYGRLLNAIDCLSFCQIEFLPNTLLYLISNFYKIEISTTNSFEALAIGTIGISVAPFLSRLPDH